MTELNLRTLLLANGRSTHTVRWANALIARGVDVHLISVQSCLPSIDSRVNIHEAPIRGPLGYFLNAPWVRKIQRQIQPDLIHAHYASGYGTLLAAARLHPAIVSVWGADIYEFPQRSRWHEHRLRYNLSCADMVLSTSHVMARRARELTSKPMQVTPFGVDLESFTPSQRPILPGREIVIGTVKALEPKYGIEFLLKAFRRVRSSLPALPLRLLIVGGGSLASSLQRLAVHLGIAEDVRFTGPVTHSEVPAYLNMMDVFVAASIDHSESFGVAVVEASAAALPVVVSNVGGLPEVVEDGVTGVIVESQNDVALAAAIEHLVVQPELRAKMGQAGRDRVRRLYDWNVNVDQMLAIYKQVIA